MPSTVTRTNVQKTMTRGCTKRAAPKPAAARRLDANSAKAFRGSVEAGAIGNGRQRLSAFLAKNRPFTEHLGLPAHRTRRLERGDRVGGLTPRVRRMPR